jgi:hypothetical protein
MLQPGQYSAAGKLLGIDRHAVSAHAGMLSELIQSDDLRQEFMQIRGLPRGCGILARTPIADIEAAAQYLIGEAAACPGKYDVVTNPENRQEKKGKMALYGMMRAHHRRFNQRKQREQRAEWKQEAESISLQPGQLLACCSLLHGAGNTSFIVVEALGSSPVQFDPQRHQALQVERARSGPRLLRRKQAFGAAVAAGGGSQRTIISDICAIAPEEIVIEVIEHIWVNRQKGDFRDSTKTIGSFFKPAAPQPITAVPVHLIRAQLDREKLSASPISADGTSGKNALRIQRKYRQGLQQKCSVFWMCYGIFTRSRPYFVQLGQKEVCVCPYHLRWQHMVLGLRSHLQSKLVSAALADTMSDEDFEELVLLLSDPMLALKSLLCERGVGCDYSHPDCIRGDCEKCGKFKLLPGALGDAAGSLLPPGNFSDIEPRKHNLRGESAVEIDATDGGEIGVGRIKYQRFTKTLVARKDGSQRELKEFVTCSVPLIEFWEDLAGFLPRFLVHHEHSKHQGRAFQHLKHHDPATRESALPRNAFRATIDYLQRHTLLHGKDITQQEWFAQLGMTLCVVSITCHLDDAENIPEQEKTKLRAFFEALGLPCLIREEHFYCSHDPERGQPAVQHILSDVFDYVTGDGRSVIISLLRFGCRAPSNIPSSHHTPK